MSNNRKVEGNLGKKLKNRMHVASTRFRDVGQINRKHGDSGTGYWCSLSCLLIRSRIEAKAPATNRPTLFLSISK